MASALHLFVRLVHVLGMAVLVGGALVAWSECRRVGADSLRLARRYEWAFWGVLGAMLVTGVGNLAAVGPPRPSTDWGTVLTLKLLLVLGLVLGSFCRTLLVLRLTDPSGDRRGAGALRPWYGATVVVLLVLVGLAEVLAHG